MSFLTFTIYASIVSVLLFLGLYVYSFYCGGVPELGGKLREILWYWIWNSFLDMLLFLINYVSNTIELKYWLLSLNTVNNLVLRVVFTYFFTITLAMGVKGIFLAKNIGYMLSIGPGLVLIFFKDFTDF